MKGKLYDGRKLLATFCEEHNYLQWSFRGTKSVTTVSVVECCTKNTCGTLSRLTWQKLPKTEAKSQSMVHVHVPLHWNSHFWRLCCYSWARNLKKTTPFCLTGTRTPQILNKGALNIITRWLAEGLVYWNSPVSSLCLADIVKSTEYMKNVWMVLDAARIVPHVHVCIAHVGCFQSQLRIHYLWCIPMERVTTFTRKSCEVKTIRINIVLPMSIQIVLLPLRWQFLWGSKNTKFCTH